MPGLKGSEFPGQDYLTPFSLYRTGVTGSETDPSAVAEEIDMSQSVTASKNTVAVVLDRTSGTEEAAEVDLFATSGGKSELTDPFLVATKSTGGGGADRELLLFTDLYAGKYKILIRTATATYSIYASYSATNDSSING